MILEHNAIMNVVEYNIVVTFPKNLQNDIIYLRTVEPKEKHERMRVIDTYIRCYDELFNWCYENNKKNLVSILQSIILGYNLDTKASKQRNLLIKKYNYKCAICESVVYDLFKIHHIIPKSSGGNSKEANLIPVCPICHDILHMFEKNSHIPKSVDIFIRRNNLFYIFSKYASHFECNYFKGYKSLKFT